MNEQLKKRVDAEVKANSVILYVKGDKEQPMCGFSATVINIFKEIGVPFETRNILADSDLRSFMKEYSNWPTFPQIYVGGEFIGGCDIAVEMFQKGELQKLVQSKLA